jgi:hypothetical protein
MGTDTGMGMGMGMGRTMRQAEKNFMGTPIRNLLQSGRPVPKLRGAAISK